MGSPRKLTATSRQRDRNQDAAGYWLDFAIQLCFLWLLASSLWYILAPEPLTTLAHSQRLMIMGIGYAVAGVLWISNASWSFATKIISGIAFGLLLVVLTVDLTRKFDASLRAMQTARVMDGRVYHDGIGLSYSIIPHSSAVLRPLIMRTSHAAQSADSTAAIRLHDGEVAVLGQIALAPHSGQPATARSSITVWTQLWRGWHPTEFLREIRKQEAKKAAEDNVQITEHTRQTRIAGLDMVEFEFVTKPQHRLVRQIYLRTSPFMVTFIIQVCHEADRPLMDEFLNSIKLEPLVQR